MKRAFHDRLLIIIALCFACCLAGCSAGLPQSGAESMSEQATENQGVLQEQRNCVEQLGIPSASDTVTQTPTPKAEHARNVDFRYIYRGFTVVSLEDRAAFEDFSKFGTKIILNENDWHSFMASFCPGIPYYESWDFSKECLLASVILGARPTHAVSIETTSIILEDGHWVFTFDNDPANYIYAMNTDASTHFYVEVMVIRIEDLPEDSDDWTYHPNE